MRKYYEVNIAHNGKVETHTFDTKKAKNIWLVQYLTVGGGSAWGRTQYEKHLQEKKLQGKKPMNFERYILSIVKDVERLTIRNRHETIIIREKIFENI